MNEFMVTPRRVVEMGLPGLNFMYPGDEWDSELRSFRSEEAIRKYMVDVVSPKPVRPTPPPVDARNIQDSANRMMQTLRSQFGRFLIHRVPPERFYLHDLDKVLVVNPSGTCEVMQADEASRRNARFVLCSQMAWYTFSYLWGWNAMEASGMYLDRRWQEPWPLAFYLNAGNSDFLNFGSARQSMRTLAFLWAKRYEIAARILQKVLGDKPDSDWEEKLTPQDEDAFSRVANRPAG